MGSLDEKVAVVTGASRGAGRGIAVELGAAGATVYATGRSVRGGDTTHGRPETIDETSGLVTTAGGSGIAVPCDHTDDGQVRALYERVASEQGRLDILVANAWGGYERDVFSKWKDPFWEQDLAVWDRMFNAGVRSHLTSVQYAAALLIKRGGLVVLTTSPVGETYRQSLSYHVSKRTVNLLAECMAHDFRKHDVAVVAIAPGWMRTEVILEHYKTDEAHWQDVKDLATTESPRYIGRAVVALATDDDVMKRSGAYYEAGELARQYGFTDVDGRVVPPFSEVLP